MSFDQDMKRLRKRKDVLLALRKELAKKTMGINSALVSQENVNESLQETNFLTALAWLFCEYKSMPNLEKMVCHRDMHLCQVLDLITEMCGHAISAHKENKTG